MYTIKICATFKGVKMVVWRKLFGPMRFFKAATPVPLSDSPFTLFVFSIVGSTEHVSGLKKKLSLRILKFNLKVVKSLLEELKKDNRVCLR